MSLKKLLIKYDYDSSIEDVYNEFFSKVLTTSQYYFRIGGFFSSKNLALAASGLQDFIKNNGKMRLVLSPRFTSEDINAIKEGVLTPEKHITKEWIDDLDSIKDKFQIDHVRALAWMIANKNLEIKILLIKDSNDNLISYDQLENEGFFQETRGIIVDEEKNIISFRGIINDFDSQSFRVYKSWTEGQNDFVEEDYKYFDSYWQSPSKEYLYDKKFTRKIVSIPLLKAIEDKILTYKPRKIEDIKTIKIPKLFDYQINAIDSWYQNRKRGIFEMATGTGKTFTAIGCIKLLEEKEKNLFVTIIVVPYINLVNQWKEDLKKWGYESIDTIDNRKKWIKKIFHEQKNMKYGIRKDNLIILTTYETFSSKNFIDLINNEQLNYFLIADEVHSSGSEIRKKGLIQNYVFRLGLSATPERYFDDEGTDTIIKFFDSIVYQLNLRDAIRNGFLCQYEYYPFFVDLTDDETADYKKLTKKIALNWNQLKGTEVDKRTLLRELYIYKRSKIIRDARLKILKFKELIENEKGKLGYCLVYCSENQIDVAQEILTKNFLINHRITAETPIEQRIKYLEMFEKGKYDVIVSIKVLDEGLNIPAVKNAIILASTGNPKQYIQRRGRVLRKFYGQYKDGSKKDFARIFDILVIPKISSDDPTYSLERSIVLKEILRYEEMITLSRNPEFGITQLKKIKDRYNISKILT